MKKKVLIVDDDPSILEILSLVLEEKLEVYSKDRGGAALAFSSEMPDIDLILLDNILKDVVGSDIVSELRRLYPRAKIILMSGNILTQQADSIKGIHMFLEKPFNLDTILDTIDDVLGIKEKQLNC